MYARLALFGLIALMSISSVAIAASELKRPLRILHVMSYHRSWEWNKEQLQGFKDSLAVSNAEYKIVDLDTKRQNAPEALAAKIKQAKTLIHEWKPDLLYTNDDNAQKYVAQDYVGTELPIVFSAVNRDPSEYGFMGAQNVTGVMEHEHIIPTVNFLRSLAKDIKRIAVIIDPDPTWRGVVTRMRAALKSSPDVEITDWILVQDLADYKAKILDLQSKVDAIALLGIFNIKDTSGNNVDYKSILKWTAQNSKLPDFAFWESRIEQGTLCAVAVSGYEQGNLAGKMARKILVEGKAPHTIKMRPSTKGEPMLSLARAKDLDLKIDAQTLLNSHVKKDYAWSK